MMPTVAVWIVILTGPHITKPKMTRLIVKEIGEITYDRYSNYCSIGARTYLHLGTRKADALMRYVIRDSTHSGRGEICGRYASKERALAYVKDCELNWDAPKDRFYVWDKELKERVS